MRLVIYSIFIFLFKFKLTLVTGGLVLSNQVIFITHQYLKFIGKNKYQTKIIKVYIMYTYCRRKVDKL